MRERASRGLALGAMVAAATAVVAVGCQEQKFVGEQGFYSFALTEDTPPYFSTDEATLYLVEERVELPIKEPSADKLQQLQMEAEGQDLPFPRMPWVKRGDYEIELDWTLRNLDAEPHTVEVVINGFNEFHEYQPSFVVDDDEIIPEFAQWERRLELDGIPDGAGEELQPLAERSGTIREEAFDEAAVDLATVVNGAPNANQIVHPNSRSATDPRSQMYIPSVIPALTGFRLGLRSEGQANVVLEATVRVRDVEDRIVGPNRAWELPEPMIFTPTSMAP